MAEAIENTTRNWAISTGDSLPDYLVNALRTTPVDDIEFEDRVLTITLRGGLSILFRIPNDEKVRVEY